MPHITFFFCNIDPGRRAQGHFRRLSTIVVTVPRILLHLSLAALLQNRLELNQHVSDIQVLPSDVFGGFK